MNGIMEETEKTNKADRVCQLVMDKINSILPELAELGGADLDPFIQDLQEQVQGQPEDVRQLLTKVVLLGLLQEMAGIALYDHLEKVNEFIPDDSIPAGILPN